jgi:ribonuclease P protein component
LSITFRANKLPLSEIGSNSFPRNQRLKSKKISDLVFDKGGKAKAFPVIARFLDTALPEPVAVQVMVTVSKKKFKRAVDRNRVKRLLREAWRLEKPDMENRLTADEKQRAIVFIFVGNELPEFEEVQSAIASLVSQMASAVQDQD